MSLLKKLKKYAKAPLEQVRSDIRDPKASTKQALFDPIGRLKQGATGEGNLSDFGDPPEAPAGLSEEELAKQAAQQKRDKALASALASKDIFAYNAAISAYRSEIGELPDAMPDDESLRLKARREGYRTMRDRNTLSNRASAFMSRASRATPNVNKTKQPVKSTFMPTGYYNNRRVIQ